jgi:pseudouridine synthase
VFPVGRLDKESDGLIILTNDGRITNYLIHPRYEHEKEYLVETF